MPLRRGTPLVLALILTATFTACIAESARTASLARALRVQYPTARMDIGFMNGGTHHLAVTVDDSSKRKLSDSALQTQGRTIAHFVLDVYPAATDLDSITIRFVRDRFERSFLSESYSVIEARFATRDLH